MRPSKPAETSAVRGSATDPDSFNIGVANKKGAHLDTVLPVDIVCHSR